MQRDGKPAPLTTGHFRASASQLGFSPPPVPVRVKLVPGKTWTLFIQSEPDLANSALVEWLSAWRPLRIEFGSRGVMRADFDPLPPAWKERFGALDLDMARLSPDGEGDVTVRGQRAAILAFSRLLARPGAPAKVIHLADDPPEVRLLTQAQDQALRAAVGAGYYLVPRPINLHQLAARLHVSSSSLSERLRRAEGRVITRFVDQGARSPWDERTLYDAYAARSAEDIAVEGTADSLGDG